VAQRKEELRLKAAQDEQDKKNFKICRDNHNIHGTDPLYCCCTAVLDGVTKCRWKGWELCLNPPCSVLLQPNKVCRKKMCAQWRKANGEIVRKPRPNKRAKSTTAAPRPKRNAGRAVSSAKYYSDTSSDSSDDEPPTPRKQLPRRVFIRESPPKAALAESGTSSESEPEPPAPTPRQKKMVREPTLTLEGEYVIENILQGPRLADGKYLVRWQGYDASGDTWEPRANLPDDISNLMLDESSSDESGDDQPLHLQVALPPPCHPPCL
jgi:hypothetical protein